jgi:hypothetical protein
MGNQNTINILRLVPLEINSELAGNSKPHPELIPKLKIPAASDVGSPMVG